MIFFFMKKYDKVEASQKIKGQIERERERERAKLNSSWQGREQG